MNKQTETLPYLNTKIMRTVRNLWHEAILRQVSQHPELTFAEVGAWFGVTGNWIGQLCRRAGLKRGRGWKLEKKSKEFPKS
jgi:hypothetical protein